MQLLIDIILPDVYITMCYILYIVYNREWKIKHFLEVKYF